MTPGKKNSYSSLAKISIDNKEYKYYSLKEAEKNGLEGISSLPKSLKVLLENLLRYEDDLSVNKNQINSIKEWLKSKKSNTEIAYRPARVLLQDYTGIPAVADLAAMREAVKDKNKYLRARARQIGFKITSDSLGTMWKLGSPRLDGRPDGRR